jgi:hypothetical protein
MISVLENVLKWKSLFFRKSSSLTFEKKKKVLNFSESEGNIITIQ